MPYICSLKNWIIISGRKTRKIMGKQPESLDKITKARLAFSSLGSICSIALTMFFVGLIAVLAFFSTQYLRNISQNLELEVLFFATTPQQTTSTVDSATVVTTVNQAVPESDIRDYELTLKREPFVATSRFSSRAENIEITKKLLRNDFEKYTDNPINASIILTLKPEYTNADSLAKVVQFIKRNEKVQEVTYPDIIAEFIQTNLYTTQWIVLGICGVFLFISLILIGNSLRLNIYAKRFNIRSLLLIGATRSFVRKPFLTKGFVQGLIGGAIATAGIALVLIAGQNILPNFINFAQFTSTEKYLYLSLLLGGLFCFSILFTTISALIFTNRYIKINPDSLYL